MLDVVAGRAGSAASAAHVRALRPSSDPEIIQRVHAQLAGVRNIFEEERGWLSVKIPAAAESLARLGVQGTSLSSQELRVIGMLLASGRAMRTFLDDKGHSAVSRAVLEQFIAALFAKKVLESQIEKAIDDNGVVRDEASPALRRIRRELRGAESELVRLLEKIMAKLEPHQRVADMSVTLRNGRYVIPVRRESRSVIGGIVHDASSTGATLFVEPPAAVEAGNRMRELEADEAEEVERILRELTETVRPHADDLSGSYVAMVELDSLYARVRYGAELESEPVEFNSPENGFAIFNGRHPLLLAQGIPVVPFDLEMQAQERTLLVSGPNTGGKTVLLKSLGLFSALTQSGVPIPVGKATRVAIFDDVFADIGDEQSIESSLSTFSAHVKNLSEILRAATSSSLVLIDELGSGTDPVEGAALGGAVLEELTQRRTISVATTHLGALKELALEVPAIVNASLQFDAEELAPTYRLIKGIPGRSYGISIARRLKLPEDVIRRAEQRLPEGERDVSALIASLEKRDEELAAAEHDALNRSEDLAVRAARIAERERNVREREREIETRARRDTRQYLLDARGDIERAITEMQSRTAESDAAARDARKRVEELAETQAQALERLEREELDLAEAGPSDAAIGIDDWVIIGSLGASAKKGKVLELRDSDAVVLLGSVKMSVPVATLMRVTAPDAGQPEIRVPIRGDLPEVSASSEIDVRGMRADEIEDIVMHAVDSAFRADLKAIRIIHGKGTGALRERVAEMLRKESRVTGFRLGAWNEGGAGVTVVELG